MSWLFLNQTLVPKQDRLKQAHIQAIEEAIMSRVTVPEGEVNAAFISEERMQTLNREYRDKDKVTDVLAFSYLEAGDDDGVLGDVVISYEQAVRQQQEGLERELVTLLVHGTLHVLGYDHIQPEDAEVMFPIQDSVVNQVLQ